MTVSKKTRGVPVPLPEVRWPTAEEASASRLFSPCSLGPIELRRRTWVPAMVPWRATDEGVVTPEVLAWYELFARGKPGALVVEATGIRDVPSGPLLRIGDDRFLPGLRELVRTVREASEGETRLFIQVIDFLTIRRRPEREKFLGRFLRVRGGHGQKLAEVTGDRGAAELDEAGVRAALIALDDERLRQVLSARELDDLQRGYRESVNDQHVPHVAHLPRRLPSLFAAASRRAREAGFDGVELHYAHAYTMASFLSRTNERRDGYGGCREARVRLPLEVFAAVRAEVGADWPVGCRFLADEIIAGGSGPEDAAWYGERFARAGMDFLSLSRGGKFDDAKRPKVGAAIYPYTGPSGLECMPTVRIDERGPFGRNLEATARVRESVRDAGFDTPIIACGGIHAFDQAERALHDGTCDIVAAARQSLADPDWFLKMELGHGSQVRRCIYTNYCEGLDQKHVEVTCQLWDRELEEGSSVARSKDGKRRLTPPPWHPPA